MQSTSVHFRICIDTQYSYHHIIHTQRLSSLLYCKVCFEKPRDFTKIQTQEKDLIMLSSFTSYSRPEALCSLQQGDGTFEISRSDLPLVTQGTKDYTIYTPMKCYCC